MSVRGQLLEEVKADMRKFNKAVDLYRPVLDRNIANVYNKFAPSADSQHLWQDQRIMRALCRHFACHHEDPDLGNTSTLAGSIGDAKSNANSQRESNIVADPEGKPLKASPKYKALSNLSSDRSLEELTPIRGLFLTMGLCISDVDHIPDAGQLSGLSKSVM